MIPDFDENGLLPPEDFELTLSQLKNSVLVAGSKALPNWDAAWRLKLVENLSVMCRQLWQVGVQDIFVDGSFVEDKDHPNDIDGYFVCDFRRFASGDLERDLNLLDSNKIWTWDPNSRRAFRGYPKRQLPMWHAYRVELYPHFGQLSGIKDKALPPNLWVKKCKYFSGFRRRFCALV
jgi:hypothetical protein